MKKQIIVIFSVALSFLSNGEDLRELDVKSPSILLKTVLDKHTSLSLKYYQYKNGRSVGVFEETSTDRLLLLIVPDGKLLKTKAELDKQPFNPEISIESLEVTGNRGSTEKTKPFKYQIPVGIWLTAPLKGKLEIEFEIENTDSKSEISFTRKEDGSWDGFLRMGSSKNGENHE